MKKPRNKDKPYIELRCFRADSEFRDEICVNGHVITVSEAHKISDWLLRAAAWKAERSPR